MRKRTITNLFIAFLSILITSATGASSLADSKNSVFEQLSYAEVVEVALEFDMDALTSDIRNDEKHISTLTYEDAQGIIHSWNTKVQLRGKFRRMNCGGMPPMKIYFDKEELKAAGLAKYNDLKLVNHCFEDKTIAKNLLFKEYLAYKMYNELTDLSYRVQLLKITFKDTKSDRKIKQWAFVIEDTAELRGRLNLANHEKAYGLPKEMLDIQQMKIMSLFQYMIGNFDWNLELGRNIKMFLQDDKLVAVPYDFDFSIMVNAPYATFNTKLNLKSKEDRVWLGLPEAALSLDWTMALYEAKKQRLFDLIKDCKPLSYQSKLEMHDYLKSFYDNLNAAAIESNIPIHKKVADQNEVHSK